MKHKRIIGLVTAFLTALSLYPAAMAENDTMYSVSA